MIQISVFHTRNDRFTRLEVSPLVRQQLGWGLSMWPLPKREMDALTSTVINVLRQQSRIRG